MDALTQQLIEALRGMPDDGGMIEHNPDEGMRLFCCNGKVAHSFRGDDQVQHSADCWYVKVRKAAASLEARQQDNTRAYTDPFGPTRGPSTALRGNYPELPGTTSAPAGDHTAEPWCADMSNGYRTAIKSGEHVVARAYVPATPGQTSRTYNEVGANAEANARRIVACVNACAGIPTELLESGNRDDIAADFLALHNGYTA